MLRFMTGGLRSGSRWSLYWLDRLIAIDALVFAAAMLYKLYYFSTLLSVPYMDMTRTDAIIELGAVLLVCFWTLLLPTRGRIIALVILNVILSFLLFADVIYYRYFQDLITVPVLMQIGQVESLGGSIGTLIHWFDYMLFIDLLAVIPYAVYVAWKGRRDLRQAKENRAAAPRWRKALVRIVLSAGVLLLGSNLFFSNVNEAKETWAKSVFIGNWWNLSLYNVTGELGFHGYDMYRYAKLHWFGAVKVSAEQLSEAQLWMEERGNQRGELEKDGLFGAYKGKNVMMVQVEALQSFMLGQSIGGQEITPVLNELMQESAYFKQFYHQTGSGRTSDADFTAHCSLQPVKDGSVFIQYASNEFDCMPQTLKDNGYSANVFHAYQGGFWNRNVMYNRMNYDYFYSLKNFNLDEQTGWALGDKSFFKQSMDVIADLPNPFYAFLITLTSHHPFTMPAEEKKLNVEQLEGTIMGNYLQAVHYVDAALGELIERMKAEGVWDNTILILFGDHDNSIKDWKLYDPFLGHPADELEQHMLMKKIPLLIHLPGDEHAGVYTQAGGQLDITPTILHLLGISSAEHYLLGMPLLTEQQPPEHLIVHRTGFWTDGALYYIPSEDGLAENGKCYQLSTGTLTDINACMPKTEKANTELMMSDQIVMNNLIRDFKRHGTFEALERQTE